MVLQRKHEYFTINLMGLMAVICTLAFTSLAIGAEDFNDRSALVLTILLTAVSFKFAVSDALPKVFALIAYLTLTASHCLTKGVSTNHVLLCPFARYYHLCR